MSLKVFWVVDIKCAVNVLQRGVLIQRRSINKVIVGPIYGQPCGLQTLVWFKPIVAGFLPASELIDRKGVLLGRFIASRRIFLYGHTGCCGLLRNLGLYLRFVVLQGLVEVGQLRRLRQLILALIQHGAALLHIRKNRITIGSFFRRQGFPGL